MVHQQPADAGLQLGAYGSAWRARKPAVTGASFGLEEQRAAGSSPVGQTAGEHTMSESMDA